MEVWGTEDVIDMTGKSAINYAAMLSSAVAILVVARVAAAQDSAKGSAPNYAAVVAAPDRTDADRQTDQRRDPLHLLVFAAPRPGMKVLDMGAGGGYSTELMARAGEFADAAIRSVTRIGDALAPGAIVHAVYSGHRYARELDADPATVRYRRDAPLPRHE